MLRVPLWILLTILFGTVWSGVVRAEASWREEFERICAKTGEVGKLGEAELSRLIAESDSLREKITVSNDPDSKVYLFRLGKCRNLFQFMKEIGRPAPQP